MVRYDRGSGRPPRWYVYAWRGGPLIVKKDSKMKPRLTAEEVRAITTAHENQKVYFTDDNTLQAMIRAWRSLTPDRPSSPEWERLADSTKRTWGSALNLIEDKWGTTPLSLWNDPRMKAKVVNWRDSRSETPRAADIGVTVLGALLKFGTLRGMLSTNVAADIPNLYRNGGRAEIVWTDQDIEAFTAKAVELGRPQIADGLRLAALTGLRRADLVTLTWDDVTEFTIHKLALKRSAGKRRRVAIARIPALDALLEELRTRPRQEGVNTVLTNSFGEAWSVSGFGGSFNRIRDEANIAHLDPDTGERIFKHLHDVRGTFCTRLIVDAQLSNTEIGEIMGWAPDRVAAIRRIYVDSSKVARAIGERMRSRKEAP